MSQSTTADEYEIISATKDDILGEIEVDISANRWTKRGHDRLYLNDDGKLEKYGYYLGLEAMEPGDSSKSTYADGTDVTVDEDTITLEIVDKWEIVIRREG